MYHWLAVIAALAGSDPVSLKPSTQWTVDYQQNACVLSRHFGLPSGSIELAFEPSMVNDGGRLAFVLPHKGGVGIVQGKTNIALQPSGKTVTATFVSVPLKERRSIVMVVGAQDVDDLVAAKTIGVQLERGVPIILQTGGMTGARQALRTCQEDLARQWGVDPADKIPDSDIPAIGTWFDGDAYPGEAIRSGAEGRTLALITIRDDGKVDTCRTLVSSGTKALDQAACRAAMRKARFPRVERDPKAKLRWLVVPVNWNLAS